MPVDNALSLDVALGSGELAISFEPDNYADNGDLLISPCTMQRLAKAYENYRSIDTGSKDREGKVIKCKRDIVFVIKKDALVAPPIEEPVEQEQEPAQAIEEAGTEDFDTFIEKKVA